MLRAITLAIGCFLIVLGVESLMIDSVLVQTAYMPASLLPETATDSALFAFKPSMMVTILLFFAGSAIIYRVALKRTGKRTESSVSVTIAGPAPISQSAPRVRPPALMPVYNESSNDDTEDDDDDWDTDVASTSSADQLMASLNEEFDIDEMLREAG